MRRMGFSLAREYMLNAGRAHGGKNCGDASSVELSMDSLASVRSMK